MKYGLTKKLNKLTITIMSCILFLCACFVGTFFFVGEKPVFAVNWSIAPSDTTFLTTGEGTVQKPYKIATAAQLATVSKNIATFKTKSFELMSNLDVSNYEWVPIGTSSNSYSGTFNGKGYAISGLRIDESSNYSYAGLFGYLSSATIKNLTLVAEKNNYVVSKTNTLSSAAGALAGYAEYSILDNILNFNVDVYSLSKAASSYAGGIVGQAYFTTFNRVVNLGDVNSLTGDALSNSYAGGIAGYTYMGRLDYTRNDGLIEGHYSKLFVGLQQLRAYDATPQEPNPKVFTTKIYAGGNVGYSESNISLSYNTNSVNSGIVTESLQVPNGYTYKTDLPQHAYAGGICGYAKNTISKVYNTGKITSNANTNVTDTTESVDVSGYQAGTEVDNHFYTIGSAYLDVSFKHNTSPLDIKDIGKVTLSKTNSFAGGIAGYSSNAISNAYNDGAIFGGGILKKIQLSADFETSTFTTYITGVSFTTIEGNYYYMNITYCDTMYYGPISGNREVVHTNTYGNSSYLDQKILLNGTSYFITGNPSGFNKTVIENYDSITNTYFYPPTNKVSSDLFLNGKPVTYIDNIRFVSSVSRKDDNATLNFEARATYYYRKKKNGFGFFTDDKYTPADIIIPMYSSFSLSQNINFTVKNSSTIKASDLGIEWFKTSDKNGNRPFLKEFYW